MHVRRPVPFGLLVVLCLAFLATPASSAIKGRAYGVYANLPSLGVSSVTNCDSGWLNAISGGARSSYKNNVSYGNTLYVDHMESESHGDRCKGHSGSKLDAGWILRGQRAEVTWTHMESADEDTCCRPEDADDIASVFAGLTFGGTPVAVTGRPNQVVSIPGVATLILNESRHDADGDCDDDDSEHRALHLILANGEEVILASSKFDSDDDCCFASPTRPTTWGALKSHYR